MNRFNRAITTYIFFLIGLCIAQQAMANLKNDLQDGQHVLLMRHADAPGFGDPAGYIVTQCATQRNLGDYGKRQAKAIGIWLTNQGIQKAEVFSSPWCRCLDTATLLNKGPVKIEPSLGSFFDDMSLEKRQTKALEAFTGKVVGVGDMVLVKVNKNGEHVSHTIYPSPKI